MIDLFSRLIRPEPFSIAEENDAEWVEQFLDEGVGEFHQEVAVLMASTTKAEVLDAIETIRRTVASWPGA